jgi:hypothetical protein
MKPQRIIRPATAFSVGRPSTKKRPRDENGKHLAFIRRLPCVACGDRRSVDAAHIRMASPVHGKQEAGLGAKPDDKWTLPLCRSHHNEQHDIGEAQFWSALNIDPCNLALAIWAHTGDDDMAETVIRLQRERAKMVITP